MNDTMSLLLATTILAVGGIGLYMYKSDDEQKGGEEYNEDSLFSSGDFWSSKNSDDDTEKDFEEDFEEDYYEPKVRTRGGKTKRNRKSSGTKRRYY